jgi:predicted metal-dependent hydrolase
METTLKLGLIVADLVRKDIKNVHLSVYPPSGRVRISAPTHMNVDTVRAFAVSKLGWIKMQQRQILSQEREAPREYLERESHYVWGKRYLLQLVERDGPPRIELRARRLVLELRPDTAFELREKILDAWYRAQLREAAVPLIAKWEPRLAVRVDRLFIQRMKTKWGSCNRVARAIRLNTELAKKPRECLEYIVIHEMVHLLEPNHGKGFIERMERAMPLWRQNRKQLNQLPVRHEDWLY